VLPTVPLAGRAAGRTHSTGLCSTRCAQARAGSSVSASADAGGVVRAGSARSQLAHREDFQPVRRPCRAGEFANAPSRTGPTACTAAQRAPTADRSPASRQTCTAAVAHMPLRPAGPCRSKACSMAR
jgi:hypothetical protein